MVERTHINGIPVERWGMWCLHGKHIVVVDPGDTREYPDAVFADPWPCDEGCTPERVDRDMIHEQMEYEKERWDEYYSEIRASLNWNQSNHGLDDYMDREQQSIDHWSSVCQWFGGGYDDRLP